MKISSKTDYALRALVSLVDNYGQRPVSIRELAQENDIPRRFLEHIMLDLKSTGWVTSVPGRDGGYKLAKPPEDISMGNVVRHFDGVLAPIGCVSVAHNKPCSQESVCRFRRVLLTIRNDTARLMDRTTLLDVSRGQPVGQQEVFRGFVEGGGI